MSALRRPHRGRLAGADEGRAGEAAVHRPRPAPGLELLVDTGLADRVLPELPALRLTVDGEHRHKDVYQHSLTVLQQAIELEHARFPGQRARRRAAASPRCCTTSASPPPGGSRRGPGHLPPPRRGRGEARAQAAEGAAVPERREIEQVATLIELHQRFFGYGEGAWTDSAVRRYVRDAGDLLPRLHILTRADVTTRNQRKARRLATAYDDLERRIAELAGAGGARTPSGPTSTARRSCGSSA